MATILREHAEQLVPVRCDEHVAGELWYTHARIVAPFHPEARRGRVVPKRNPQDFPAWQVGKAGNIGLWNDAGQQAQRGYNPVRPRLKSQIALSEPAGLLLQRALLLRRMSLWAHPV